MKEEEALKKLEISNWRELSKDKLLKFFSFADKLDKEVHLKIIEQVPGYIKLVSDTVKSTTDVAEQNERITAQVISALNNISTGLNSFINKENLSEQEALSALEIIREIAKILSNINNTDKEFRGNVIWSKITFVAGAIVAIGMIALGKGKFLKNNS